MHPYLYPGLEAGPQTIRRLIRQIGPDQMDVPTHPDRFSPRYVVAHLADWEPISRGRMQTAVANPGAGVPGIDEVVRAEEQGYSSWDPLEQAEVFITRRAETLAFLKSLAPEDWAKTSVHSERGAMTVYDYANMELGHDLYHVIQLASVLRGDGK
ncbi:MAG TPA: DinB family protein [Fimbriimonadaceae bacterium]|nr:DinB family protein [Fimbriimonadaceae bacterium]